MEIKITPVNKTAEENGSWGTYRGVRLLIARANNTKFKTMFRRLSKPFSKEIEKGTISEEDGEELLCSTLASTVLLNWENFVINGKTIEYNQANAKALLVNDPDCRIYVQEFSQDLDNYINDNIEATKGE